MNTEIRNFKLENSQVNCKKSMKFVCLWLTRMVYSVIMNRIKEKLKMPFYRRRYK